jgi:exodeoxyribonuclease VII small subunit
MPPRKSNDTTSFESEFERLNAIVDKLETGNVPLSEMIALYEEAMKTAASLKEVLSEAELRVEKLAATHEEIGNTEESLEDLY